MRRLQIFGEEKPKTLTPPSAMDIEDRPIISERVLPCQVVYSSQYWTMKGMDRYLSDRSYHVREIARRVPLTRQRVLTIWYLLLVWIVGARNGVLALILAGKAAGAGLMINAY